MTLKRRMTVLLIAGLDTTPRVVQWDADALLRRKPWHR
jgi:hypothetical protein